MMNLQCKFSEYLKIKLKNYTLLIKKPNDLEIKLKRYDKKTAGIIEDGLNESYYCINFDYKNTSQVFHLFELQADLDANGYLEVFFHVGEIDVVYDEFTSNKSNLFKEKLFLKDIEIAKDNFIIIDRR